MIGTDIASKLNWMEEKGVHIWIGDEGGPYLLSKYSLSHDPFHVKIWQMTAEFYLKCFKVK